MSVNPNSAATNTGLAPGDVIVELNRRRVVSVADAAEVSRQSKAQRVLPQVGRDDSTRFVVLDRAKRN